MVETSAIEVSGLLPALRRLDALLVRATDIAAGLYGPGASDDPYRGLVIGPDEVARLLQRTPGAPTLFAADGVAGDPADAYGHELAWLGQAFGLTPFDLDLLVLAIAPELDLRYERLYAYLQDDATRKRPTVDLALNLLCGSAADRIAQRARFAVDAPLIHHELLHLIGDPNQPHQPLLSRALKIDEQILRFVLREPSLDSRLAGCARVTESERALRDLSLAAETWRALPIRAMLSGAGSPPPRLVFQGPKGCGQTETAEALAHKAGVPLLAVDLDRARNADTALDATIRIAFREAWLRGFALVLTGVEPVLDDASTHDQLMDAVSTSRVLTILVGDMPWAPAAHGFEGQTGAVVVPFPMPEVSTRRACWTAALTDAGFTVDDQIADMLAGHYRLTAARIAEAMATARNQAEWTGNALTPADLFRTARAQSGHELAASARKITPIHRWEALILPDEALDQLRELRDRVAQRQRVLGEWGFNSVLALGKGICALFAGPSGSGKTMAAEVVSGELGLDLYKIDLATVVSKYIGETEKNLERIFDAAERANAVLFFDEADAIFGKRSEVRDAHDRYANLEIAYLLQKMEQYDGIAILATNLRQNLDEAFLRRLHFIIEFPLPDAYHRELMWRQFIPLDAPTDDSIDYAFLAQHFRLSGGNIKNIVVSAAYLAASNGGCINMPHLIRATWREHQKIGRLLSESDIGDYAAVLPPHA